MIKRVIVLKNNIPLINRNYEPEGTDSSGSLGTFQAIVDNVSSKALPGLKNEEHINNYKVVYQLDESVLFLVGADANEVGLQEIFLDELKSLFYAVFPKDFISNWPGDDTSVFKGFDAKLDQLRSAFENRIMTKPGSRRVLDTLSVMELPQRLQKTAYAILDAKIASFEQVIQLTNVTPQEAVANIQEILNAGFLYTTKIGSRVYYSIKSFGEAQPIETVPSIAPTTETIPRETVQPTTATEMPSDLEVKKRDINRGNVPFLMKQFKKDLDKIFDAIISRKTTLLLLDPETDKNEVLLNMVLDTLQCFAPERELRIINFTNDFIHPREADIIRIDRDLQKFYSNELTVDIDNKRITNGDNSLYLADIIKEMSKMKHSECVSLLLNRVALIEKLAQDWAKIKKLNLPTEDFITNVRNKHNPAIIQVMDKVAANIYMD
ncbi:MAG: hypothetical protein FK731_06905 [Asgard group archaeon]|nr:hypothetical protein [Asgard group archaeon]